MKIRYKAILLCGILMLLICSAASAAETAEVHIPILAQGADCTAELTDLLGNRLQLLELKEGIPGEFAIECTGLMRFSYSIRLIDKDTAEITYDHSIYTVYVDLFRNDNDSIYYMITIELAGSPGEGKKVSSIVFVNRIVLPTETPTPTMTPEYLPPFPYPVLPETGFSSSRPQHQERVDAAAIHKYTGWSLQIPSLSLNTEIVTVPLVEKNFEVSYLENKAGLLEGYALPGDGRTIITGHDHLSRTEIGPFAFLYDMEIGDRIFFLDPQNNILIFEVYANEKITADDIAGLERISGSWPQSATFITCEDEQPEGGYANRRIIAAKPVSQKGTD